MWMMFCRENDRATFSNDCLGGLRNRRRRNRNRSFYKPLFEFRPFDSINRHDLTVREDFIGMNKTIVVRCYYGNIEIEIVFFLIEEIII
ncbi:hypothetical protein MIMGU_mgv1a017218mg [Erythranthe guttata]|uniref:Uncharacterized protein n=1 Tax=Erythranthe guttata TaxID=4155 RepID=A0A022R8A2_ERYGU|nr:hypothetical protein MIMGU_mgv1a017218mg [Erythranthe guttata]